MRAALHDLQLARLFIVYPGDKAYALNEQLEVLPLARVAHLNLSEKR